MKYDLKPKNRRPAAACRRFALLSGIVVSVATMNAAFAQTNADNHQPLSQHSPPGQTAAWFNAIRKYDPSWMQPISVETPSGGNVSVFSGSNIPVGTAASPAKMAANVGHLYRFRITDMPEFPGVEVFPTVELVDRLHPPAGREFDFPIPIILTRQDILTVEQGQLVTRVIYLEQPQFAQVLDPLRRQIPQQVSPSENALKEADRLGRPMAIIRIGGRHPSPNSPPSFFGTGGAVQLYAPPSNDETAPAVVRLRSQQARRDLIW